MRTIKEVIIAPAQELDLFSHRRYTGAQSLYLLFLNVLFGLIAYTVLCPFVIVGLAFSMISLFVDLLEMMFLAHQKWLKKGRKRNEA